MPRAPAVIALGWLLVACATADRSVDSPHYVVPSGSTLRLEQPVTVPYPGVSVWLQGGRTVPQRDRWHPACKLEMWTRPDASRVVAPDTFRITKVQREETMVSLDATFRAVAVLAPDEDAGGPTAFDMETVLYLKSPRQPDVYRLTCAQWDDPAFPRHLTVTEIRAALGPLAHIELPANDAPP